MPHLVAIIEARQHRDALSPVNAMEWGAQRRFLLRSKRCASKLLHLLFDQAHRRTTLRMLRVRRAVRMLLVWLLLVCMLLVWLPRVAPASPFVCVCVCMSVCVLHVAASRLTAW